MKAMQMGGKVLQAGALAAMLVCACPALAATPHAQPVMHHSTYARHGGVSGWHGYHHGHGFYGYWPVYFPWTYGFALPYYGTSFYSDAPVTYFEAGPDGVVQPSTLWYYCRNPEGYFPYVKECPSGWQTVPAQPVPPPQTAAPAQ